MSADQLKRGTYTVTPDGYACLILLTAGADILVFLTNVPAWPMEKRYRSYPKQYWL